jgi:hexulose-6-phosphate isomerase
MKKSISIWSFYGDWSLEQKLRLAKEAGFAGFEIDLSEDGPVNLKSATADLKAVRALADKSGVALSGLATGLYWGANACSADPAVRQKAGTILQKQIASAAALGVDAILVVPGAVGVDFIPGGEVVPYHLAYQRAQDFIKSALPAAEKAKVTLCVENVWNKFLLSPLEMKAFIDGFGSDRVGSYFDVGNTLATGYPEHWIAVLGSLQGLPARRRNSGRILRSALRRRQLAGRCGGTQDRRLSRLGDGGDDPTGAVLQTLPGSADPQHLAGDGRRPRKIVK